MFGYYVVWSSARPTMVGIVVGVMLLWLFYAVVRTSWPTAYASYGNGDYGVVVNRGAFRYFMFALAPTYFVALIVSTTVERQAGHAMVCALGIGIGHLLRTQAVMIYKTIRYSVSRLRYPVLLYAAVISVGVLVVSFLAGLGPGPAGVVVPQPADFFSALWTTAFVALFAAFVLRASTSRRDVNRVRERSEQEVGPELLTFAREAARAHDAEENLVVAILLTEDL